MLVKLYIGKVLMFCNSNRRESMPPNSAFLWVSLGNRYFVPGKEKHVES